MTPPRSRSAYRRAWDRFRPLLDELVAELPTLRRPLDDALPGPASPVGRRMAAAVRPFADRFITPMAAVAGAVADEVCAAMVAGGDLRRAYVNDGGDIALHLSPGETFDVGLVPVPRRPALLGKVTVHARRADPRRGDERPARTELLARHRRRGDRARRRRRECRRRGHVDRERRRPARASRDRAGARVRAGARQRPRVALGHDRGRAAERRRGRAGAGRGRGGSRADACRWTDSPPPCSAWTIRSRRSRAPC